MGARQLATIYQGMRPLFITLRSWCRRVYQKKRQKYIVAQEAALLLEAEKQPYKWLRRSESTSYPLSPDVLTAHFRQMFASQKTVPNGQLWCNAAWDEQADLMRNAIIADITTAELMAVIHRLKHNKAAGLDRIRPEHLK